MKVKFSSLVVILVIALNVWFAREVIELVRDSGIEPTVLITAFFAFTTGELWCLTDIKRRKIDKKGEASPNEKEDFLQ